MSLGTTIGRGPGNENTVSEIAYFKAVTAVAKGEVICYEDAASDGYSVEPAASASGYGAQGIGVAKEAIAAGEWGPCYVGGFCPYMKTDGAITAGLNLVAHTVAGEASAMAAGEEHLVFAYSLAADVGDVLSKAVIIRRFV